MNKLQVIAVVVAYNSSFELNKLINAIVHQSYSVSSILCVENSNEEFRKNNQDVIFQYKKCIDITYIENNSDRTGSAKGYAIGMEYALNLKPDFVWLNDQDGIPMDDCLELLIKAYYKNNSSPGIYAPLIRAIDDEEELVNFRSNANSMLHSYHKKYDLKDTIISIDYAGTTGNLINLKVMERCGVYNGDVFYVGLEDIEYSFRAKKNGFGIYLIRNAVYHHPNLYKKYNYKFTFVSKLVRKVRAGRFCPLNMGFVKREDNSTFNKRSCAYCVGSAYINRLYANKVARIVNVGSSVLRAAFMKLIDSKVDVSYTIVLYKDGIRRANDLLEGVAYK